MCGNYSDFIPILAGARKLQIKRIQDVLETGFRLPEEVCARYLSYYQATKARSGNGDADTYKSLCAEFWAEVREKINVPAELNNLDTITLFGEVCSGEYPPAAN